MADADDGATRIEERTRELLRLAGDGPRTVVVLTDEELATIESDRAPDAWQHPWLDSVADRLDLKTATIVGARSLLVRALAGYGPGGEPWLDRDLETITTLRRTGRVVVRCARLDDEPTTTLTGTAQPSDGVVTETVTPAGVHALGVAGYRDFARQVAEHVLGATDLPPVRGLRARPTSTDEGAALVVSELGDDTRGARVDVVRLVDDAAVAEALTLACSRHGALLFRPDPAGTDLGTATPVDLDILAGLVLAVVEPAS